MPGNIEGGRGALFPNRSLRLVSWNQEQTSPDMFFREVLWSEWNVHVEKRVTLRLWIPLLGTATSFPTTELHSIRATIWGISVTTWPHYGYIFKVYNDWISTFTKEVSHSNTALNKGYDQMFSRGNEV